MGHKIIGGTMKGDRKLKRLTDLERARKMVGFVVDVLSLRYRELQMYKERAKMHSVMCRLTVFMMDTWMNKQVNAC